MTLFTLLWLGWIIYFLIVEGIALFRSKPGDTLSEHVWMWFGTDRTQTKERNGWARLRKLTLAAFLLWLGIHFLTGGWM